MKTLGVRIVILALGIKLIKCGYFFGSSSVSWETARSDCEHRGGMRLVCLRDVSMYNAAVSYLKNTVGSWSKNIWIGLYTLSTSSPYQYQCVDGQITNFQKWRTDEPDNQHKDFCIRLYESNLLYGTWGCDNSAQYLCEDVNGEWSLWTTWSACSTTCGNRLQSRFRFCDSPPPSSGGLSCAGLDNEDKPCHFIECQVNGEWSLWTAWSACSTTCGNGLQSRVRFCDSPPPSSGGLSCAGLGNEDKPCNLIECPVDGVWSMWTEWSDCIMVQCGVANQTRSRSCDSPPPSFGGCYCVGVAEETESCANTLCPSDERWTCFEIQELSPISLQEKIEEINKNLTVNTTTLSSTVRKKTCADDPRPSSKYIGVVAALFIGAYFGLMLLIDFSSFIGWTLRKCK